MRDIGTKRRDVLRHLGVGAVGVAGLGGVSAAAKPDRYIVGTASPAANRAAKSKADHVHRTLDFGDVGGAVAGRFPEPALEALSKRADVRYVEADGTMHALAQTLPWGVDRVDADLVHADGETGDGADVAIIDTGIDDDHPDLQANVGSGVAFVSCRGGGCNYEWSDDNDHGTHCAGIADAVDNDEGVVGVSTQATLHAVKVLDSQGSGSFSDVAASIEYVADQGWDVGSLSLGASSGSQTVKDACTYAYDNGVLLVAAAGNSGPCSDCVGYPAAYEECIAVSSTDSDDSLSSFSSTGSEVELAAPGGEIYSTVVGGYDTFSGTSMACPHVSGAGGQLMANGYTNTEARQQLKDTAEDVGLASNESGSGLLDVEAALGGSDGSNGAPSVDGLSASEVETDDADAEFDVSWQVSDPDGNLSSVDLTLTDDTAGETEDTASIGVSGSDASGTTRLVAADDDGSGNDYTVDLAVTDSEGATASDSTSVSETEESSGGDTAPAIDSWSVSTRTTGPWFRAESDWAVSDADGDLDAVTTELLDGDGAVLDSASSSVGGSSASGSHEVRARSSPAEVRLAVTDANGNTTTDTRSV